MGGAPSNISEACCSVCGSNAELVNTVLYAAAAGSAAGARWLPGGKAAGKGEMRVGEASKSAGVPR